MTTGASLLSEVVTALVHHVELNRSGWWEKAVQRLVLASVWLSDHPPRADEIQKTLIQEFHLSLSQAKLISAVTALVKQNLLIELQGDNYRIPDSQRGVFERDIERAEKVASEARDFFCNLVRELCSNLDAYSVWSVFESEFLAPLIKEVGANAYHLIAGERVTADKNLVDRFLNRFESESHRSLKELVTAFLDPKKEEVRAHVSRMLHARFCVEAGGLPEAVIQKLNATVGKQVQFRMFVDTNFLFSLLELHENPSNAAARELQELLTHLKSNPKVELFIIPRTIEEAKSSIAAAKIQLSGVPAGNNFTQAALQAGMSGMAERFLTERLRRDGKLTAEDWFELYLQDFVAIARGKGVEFFNESLDAYSTRQDVIEDIHLVHEFEERLDESRRKSYQKVAHDMILWHFVNDKRPAYVESPIDAQDWILTVDFRLIGFDEHKQKQSGSKVPLCLHPTSFIQLLQFWVPRTTEFEEAMLGSMRLPFLFQEFDAEAERTSLRILKGLGRFEGRDDIPEQTITSVILNDGLRSRLKFEKIEGGEVEIALIRDALVEEMKVRAEAESAKAQVLQDTVKDREAALSTLDAEKRAKDDEIERLKARIAEEKSRTKTAEEKLTAQGIEIAQLRANWEQNEDGKKRSRALVGYFGLLAAVILATVVTAWQTDRVFSDWANIFGPMPIKGLTAVVVFVVGHLLLEWGVRGNQLMTQLWPFEQVRRFRKWLWALVVLGFVLGVLGNLYANRIQKSLDQDPQSALSNPSSAERSGGPER